MEICWAFSHLFDTHSWYLIQQTSVIQIIANTLHKEMIMLSILINDLHACQFKWTLFKIYFHFLTPYSFSKIWVISKNSETTNYIYVLLVLVVLAIFTLASLLIGLEKDNPQFLLTDILRGKKKEIFSNIFISSWREKKDNDCDVRVEVQGSQCSFTTYADQYLCYSSLLGKSVPKVQSFCNKFN